MKSGIALYIGRFQPLHKGHVNVIKRLFKKCSKVVIVIGSVNKNNAENPFSFMERKLMLDAALRKYPNRYKIIGVDDYGSDMKWKNTIARKAKFDAVVTANSWTARCFAGYKIAGPVMFDPKKYNATRIRKLIRQEKNWQSLVPKDIIPIIKASKISKPPKRYL